MSVVELAMVQGGRENQRDIPRQLAPYSSWAPWGGSDDGVLLDTLPCFKTHAVKMVFS